MYKLLALDLDGTVLNSKNQISPPLLEAIQKLPDDIMVMIVTGRHHTAAKPYYDQLKLTSPIICCNGTYLYDYQHAKVINENSIAKEDAEQFLSLCDDYGLKKIMYVTNSMLYDQSNPMAHMQRLRDWSLTFPEYDRPSILKINDFATPLKDNAYIWKFVVEGEDENVEQFAAHPFIQREFSAEQSFVNRFDYARKGNSKGNRLTEYIKSIGITLDQVVAIGDNHNDISMIEIAGLGVTLSHAEEPVKQASKHIIDSDNDDPYGLANFINAIFNHSLSAQ
jgi:Cof subfamily protein (haloacid dehalogenase superfamily)